MAVLCDWEIQARCRKGDMVVPFNPELLNPASLDVRLGDHLMIESIYSPELIRIDISDRTEDEPFMLQAGEFCLAETLELFNLPDDISCQFVLKSSRARDGVNHLLAGWCDPGWHGSKAHARIEERAPASCNCAVSRLEDWSDGLPCHVKHPDAQLRGDRPLQQPLDSHALCGMN